MGWEIVKTPGAQWFDLPIIGDDFAKIGRIIQIYHTPCSPAVEVWVYAFWQAIPTLFVSLTKPEFIDTNIKHRDGKPRKGKRVKFRASHVFRDAIIEIPTPSWRVFRVYEAWQRVGWFLLVADATEQFAINWMSLAYKSEGCQAPQLGYARAENVHALQGSSTTPALRRFTWPWIAASNVQTTATYAEPVIDGQWRITWQCLFQPYENPSLNEMPYAVYLTRNGVPIEQSEVYVQNAGNHFASGSALINISGAPDGQFRIEGSWTEPSKFCYLSGYFYLDRMEGQDLEPDP